MKYNGYDYNDHFVYEHRLRVDFENSQVIYDFEGDTARWAESKFRITCNAKRNSENLLDKAFVFDAVAGQPVDLPEELMVKNGDVFLTTLEAFKDEEWQQVGTDVERQVLEGAPFTFGRALGLGSENISHGSQIYIDGVAVFDRILSGDELQSITFIDQTSVGPKKVLQNRETFLFQNYPNPFNPVTHIQYKIGRRQNVRPALYNLRGRKVAEWVNDVQAAGLHVFSFDAGTLPSGVYIYELKTGHIVQRKKMMLLR